MKQKLTQNIPKKKETKNLSEESNVSAEVKETKNLSEESNVSAEVKENKKFI